MKRLSAAIRGTRRGKARGEVSGLDRESDRGGGDHTERDLLRTLAFGSSTVPCALAAPQNSPVSSPAVLPRVTVYALDRAKVTLPAHFAAPLYLLILSFQRDQHRTSTAGCRSYRRGRAGVQTWRRRFRGRKRPHRRRFNPRRVAAAGIPAPALYGSPIRQQGAVLAILQVSSEKEVGAIATDKAGACPMARRGAGDGTAR